MPTARRSTLPGARRGSGQVASVDPASNQIAFNANAKANPGKDEDQGKIVDTPAVAYLDGPTSRRASSSAATRSTWSTRAARVA